MDEKLEKHFEEIMMKTTDAKKFNGIIVDYYKKHPKDSFEYPKDRFEQFKKPGLHTWMMEDIVVFALAQSKLRDRVKLI